MSDGLSSDDRALIDEAIAEGRVERVPVGETGYCTDYKWNPKENRIVAVDDGRPRPTFNGGKFVNQAVRTRRRRVFTMANQKMPTVDIARHLGVDVSVVHNDIAYLRWRGQTVYRKTRQEVMAENCDRVREAFDGRRTTLQIAEVVNMSPDAVRKYLRRLGLKPPRHPL